MDVAVAVPRSEFLVADGLFDHLGVLYLAGTLKARGIGVSGFHFDKDTSDDYLDGELHGKRAVLVTGLSAHRDALQRMGRYKGCWKIVGGVHATVRPTELLRWGYDVVVVGEAEDRIVELLTASGGTKVCGPVDVSNLPLPDRQLFKRELPVIYGSPAESLIVSRGCPYRCRFCSKPIAAYRRLAPDHVRREAEAAMGGGARTLVFFDDCFTVGRAWALAVTDELGRLGVKWRVSTRADCLDGELLTAMRAGGLEEICIGVETGSQAIMDTLGKGTFVADATRARALCRDAGVKFKAYIMVGLPGESRETLAVTEAWLAANLPDAVGIYLFTPMPGSDIYEHARNYDIRLDIADTYYYAGREGLESTVSTSHLTRDEITEAHRHMIRTAQSLGIQ